MNSGSSICSGDRKSIRRLVDYPLICELTAKCLNPGAVFSATVFGLTLLFARSAASDILFLNSDVKPVYGLIESIDESKIVFQVFSNADHSFSRREIQTKDVNDIVRTVDQQRLESLTIDRLTDYRDLAEELSSLGEDPVARRLAMQLSLICLHHADATEQGRGVRESAAANLLTLARNDTDREQFRLIAYLAGNSVAGLRQETKSIIRDAAVDKTMLQIVTAIRQQNSVEASRLLDSESGKTATAQWSDRCSPQLLRDAIGQQPVDPALLIKLVSIEIQIRYGDVQSKPIGEAQRFADANRQKPTGPRWLPELTEISEFDLNETKFKNGQWVRPD